MIELYARSRSAEPGGLRERRLKLSIEGFDRLAGKSSLHTPQRTLDRLEDILREGALQGVIEGQLVE